MNGDTDHRDLTVEREFLEILRKTCRTMRQSRTRPEMAIPAAKEEVRINERLEEIDRILGLELPLGRKNGKPEPATAAP